MNSFTAYVAAYWEFIVSDLMMFVGGAIAGILINGFRNVRHFQNIYISPKFKDADWNFARIKGPGNEDYIYFNPKTYWQTVEAWVTYQWWDMTGRKHDYIMQNSRLQRIIVISVFTTLALIALFELYNVFSYHYLNRDFLKAITNKDS